MHEIEVDLADDRFDVAYDPSLVSVERLLETIGALDYKTEVVDAPGERRTVADRIDPSLLPDDLQSLFAEAKTKSKPVLVEFSGPG